MSHIKVEPAESSLPPVSVEAVEGHTPSTTQHSPQEGHPADSATAAATAAGVVAAVVANVGAGAGANVDASDKAASARPVNNIFKRSS